MGRLVTRIKMAHCRDHSSQTVVSAPTEHRMLAGVGRNVVLVLIQPSLWHISLNYCFSFWFLELGFLSLSCFF